ncbi:Lipase, GDSL [Corchorus capsularis]|uniref:Lipase, GDSL n=1 Tax=Corchorus capsularis TaxID=210143 RepID=A0A1R3IK44_COCAP|nr:Lipase, GDSL [Corchorus capsularis]
MMSTTMPKFRAILIFGDSTVDTGNNNYISTLFKADRPPYGKNFPGHIPTGRFSDGKLVPDFVASFLGLKEIVPPFLQPNLSEDELCSGVSFASAGSGYDELTTAFSNVIPVSKQVHLFKNYILKLKEIVGEEEAKNIISQSLVIISAGTNDFIFNFFDIPTRRLEFNITGYQQLLLHKLEKFVKELYDLGCRKMVVAGLPPIGCLPIQMSAKFEILNDRRCLEDQNSDAQSYNKKLSKLLPQIQAMLPKSKIVYADVYEPLVDMMNYPHGYGFAETKLGCCGTGLLEASFLCNPLTPICKKPAEFLFFDSIHPTQQAYLYLAKYLEMEVLPHLFKNHSSYFESQTSEEEAKNIINEALVMISAGTNDLVFNFFDLPIRRFEFNITEYQHFLLQRLENFVKELYELGCRKMIVAGIPPIGCLPIQMSAKFKFLKDRKCLEDQNSDTQSYNQKLKKLLLEIEAMLPRSKIAYADMYETVMDMIKHPQKYGFAETKIGCCGSGLVEVSFLCNPLSPICGNSSEFLFWDSVHPSQQVYRYLAKYIHKEVVPHYF